jgi:hypothetical protein
MTSKKDRRHSGYVSPASTIKAKRKEIIDNCIEPQDFYSEWDNYRDGQRDYYRDNKKIKKTINKYKKELSSYEIKRIKYNEKNQKMLKIRKAKKIMFNK